MLIRILVFLCITSLGMAQNEERESLGGLKGVGVLVESLGPTSRQWQPLGTLNR